MSSKRRRPKFLYLREGCSQVDLRMKWLLAACVHIRMHIFGHSKYEIKIRNVRNDKHCFC